MLARMRGLKKYWPKAVIAILVVQLMLWKTSVRRILSKTLPSNAHATSRSFFEPVQMLCNAKYLACLCHHQEEGTFSKEYISKGPHLTRESCFVECSERKFQFAAITSNECICGDHFERYQSIKTSNTCPRKTIQYPDDECTGEDISSEVYILLSPCEKKNIVQETFYHHVGNFVEPPNLDKIFHLQRKDLSSAECYLLCKRQEMPLALTLPQRVCYCGYQTKRFNLKNLLQDEKGSLSVWRTEVPDNRCSTRNFLAKNAIQDVYVVSFPGSGNTWTRYLLESATGIFTGSIYWDMPLSLAGFLGENDDHIKRRYIAIKSHRILQSKEKTIVIIRNPFEALMSEYRRKAFHSHTILGDTSVFNHSDWERFCRSSTTRWLVNNKGYIEQGDPLLVIFYEDLKADPIKEVKKMVKFIGYQVKDFNKRLECLENDLTGPSKRPSSKQNLFPFSEEQVMKLNSNIKELRKFFQERDPSFPSIPAYEHE
ncbi:sialate:O-sulfotransferase 1-like isoform X1 [Clavelina lepadiformis]|uniref:sialate:O-sulfotransferase 1-like isoform X1 n=1 Tax=Clavelina lepadiformis TaxID=159417 RepID=UPI00404325D4